MQTILTEHGSSEKLARILEIEGVRRFLLVCGNSYLLLSNRKELDQISIPHVRFSDFMPNPLYEQVAAGVALFNREACDGIVAVGGGSAIDVAKCIKLYCKMDASKNYLTQKCVDSGIPLIALPTTAGTGSESTRYAVIYYEGKKQSITHESIIPNYAVLDSSVLGSLPIYQKKCTMLDALCQGIESWWSVNSTEESKAYSRQAIKLVMTNWEAYIEENASYAAEQIMLAANFAGRAINITQTTAAHAMSYMLTSMYQLPHGHAVAVCLPYVWRYMTSHLDACIDIRGAEYLSGTFGDISNEMGCTSIRAAIDCFSDMSRRMGIDRPHREKETDIDTLASSVNPVRLRNNPIRIHEPAMRSLYDSIVQ